MRAYWIEEVLGGIWAIEYAPRPLFKWVWQRRLEERRAGVARAFFVAQKPLFSSSECIYLIESWDTDAARKFRVADAREFQLA